MSHCYDVQMKAWLQLRDKLPDADKFGELAVRFEFLLSEMHEANHRLKDAINKDERVTRYARRLDDVMNGNGE